MKEIPFTIASFENFLKEKKLMASRCNKCSALWLPPRPICIKCRSDELKWVELNGKGKLVAFTVIGVGPIPMIDAGYNRDNPYCAGIVEVEEGPRISAQILGVDVVHPENIKIGTPLTADFVERGYPFLICYSYAESASIFSSLGIGPCISGQQAGDRMGLTAPNAHQRFHWPHQ